MTHFLSIFFPLVFFSLSCVGAGALVLRLFSRYRKEVSLIEFVIAFVLGQGVLGTLFLIPALAGFFTLPVLLSAILPLALVGFWQAMPLLQSMPGVLHRVMQQGIRIPWLWLLLSIATVFFMFVGISGIVIRIDGDARAFYLALPKVVAASHRLLPLPGYEAFTSVGLLAEMQLAALFLLDMPGASPRLFSWVSGLAGAVLLMDIARLAGLGKRGQLLSVVMLLTSSAVAYFWGQGKTDLFAAVYGLAAVLFALRSWDDRFGRTNSVILAGFFTGFALVAKLSYIVGFLPSIFVLVYWHDIRVYWHIHKESVAAKKLLLDCLKYGFIFICAASIPLIPHFIKNLMLLDTLMGSFGSAQYFSDETTRRIVLIYPFLLFFGAFWGQYGNLSPLLLAFFPVFIGLYWRDKQWSSPVSALFVAGAAGWLAWIVLLPSVPMLRYFLATLLIFIIPVAWAMERASFIDRWLNYYVILAAFASILMFYKSWERELFPTAAAYEYILGNQSEKNLNIDEVLSRNVYESINQNAEQGARVYLGSYYRFWLRPDLMQVTNDINNDKDISFDPANSEKFWLQVYEHGFSYMFMDNTHPAFAALNSVPNWMSIENIYPQSGYGGAYRLIYRNPPGSVRLVTKEVSPSAWDVVPIK